MSGRLENTGFEVGGSKRTSIYEGMASFAHAHYGKFGKEASISNTKNEKPKSSYALFLSPFFVLRPI